MGPLIPFIKVPELPLSFLGDIPILGDFIDPAHPPSIKPFGTLVALGVYIGAIVATRHAKERGLDLKKMSEYIFWVVGIGFIGGHVFDAIFYHPARVEREPLYLFKLWDGLSSYGGFLGAMIGAFSWRLYRNEKILPYSECINSAFPLAWVFGRAGCATVHDHPGKLSDAWFAVKWPLGEGYIGRYDLGLIEMVLTIPLAASFLILWRRRPFRPLGFYTGMMCIAYAPVRFILDFFREQEGAGLVGGDPRYGGLTPAQWASIGLLFVGLYFLRIAYGPGSSSSTGAPAPALAGAAAAAASTRGDAPEGAASDGENEGEEEAGKGTSGGAPKEPKPTRRRSRSRPRRE